MAFTGQDMIASHERGVKRGIKEGRQQAAEEAMRETQKVKRWYQSFIVFTGLTVAVISFVTLGTLKAEIEMNDHLAAVNEQLRGNQEVLNRENAVLTRQLVKAVWDDEEVKNPAANNIQDPGIIVSDDSVCFGPAKQSAAEALDQLGVKKQEVISRSQGEWIRL